MSGGWFLPWLALAPFLGAALLAGVDNRRRRTATWLAGAVTLLVLAGLLVTAPARSSAARCCVGRSTGCLRWA